MRQVLNWPPSIPAGWMGLVLFLLFFLCRTSWNTAVGVIFGNRGWKPILFDFYFSLALHFPYR